jgi:hypothetical protein
VDPSQKVLELEQVYGHKDSAFLRHLQIFPRFSFAIEVEREEMRKIIMIKVILVIFGGGTFVSVAGGTFETAMPGTFHSATGGTFETVLGGTIKPLQSKIE